MNITGTFSTAAVMLLAGALPVTAQTYREVVNMGTYVSTGNCRVESETLLCDLFRKAGKSTSSSTIVMAGPTVSSGAKTIA
ncbi:MAG: hypothetical protein WAT81_02335 [Candidatus Moraniibacteriota bacterium]